MDKFVRNIPDAVMEVLNRLAPRNKTPVTRTDQRRPNSSVIIVHVLSIRALEPPYWYQVAEIEDIAIRIAEWQRQMPEMKERRTLAENLIKEKKELQEVQHCLALGKTHQDGRPYTEIDVLYRAASIVYYISSIFLHTHEIAAFHFEMEQLALQVGVPKELLMELCLAKFSPRSRVPVAMKEYEYAEILRCKQEYERFHSPGKNS